MKKIETLQKQKEEVLVLCIDWPFLEWDILFPDSMRPVVRRITVSSPHFDERIYDITVYWTLNKNNSPWGLFPVAQEAQELIGLFFFQELMKI
jgi:hypothetical protein